MQSGRFQYFLLTIFIVFLGVGSRKINVFPLFIGDILYATMMYYGLRFVLIHWKLKTIFVLSISFCFLIEISQLFQFDWLISLRKTTFGKYVLGQGFLWSDLICYLIGTSFSYLIDSKFIKTQNLNSL
ncbi:ribosomal maturation YjgA family protein [Flavobacterium tibetense]|uniref:DUF2809 domain-containing protein n=1 Tax=Flavobacterium tibetense TaxID=2233533 RepID=A0A365NZ45_9FLAO|nr:DUF2809 domain-containing protein [Flavobacterium tibetense]RBA27535.1 DUF2809 domain-containing protein [Flavobacterium tibetense]